ncbi:MAG TPA: PEGA domain-containing protein [Polyangiaceae bacterium]
MSSWRPGLLAFLLLLACGCTPPQSPPRPTVSLRMAGTPAEAAVLVDDEAIGQLDFVAAHGVALPPGVHHVTVKAQGYFPWDREVQAKEGSPPIRLQVALVPVPD